VLVHTTGRSLSGVSNSRAARKLGKRGFGAAEQELLEAVDELAGQALGHGLVIAAAGDDQERLRAERGVADRGGRVGVGDDDDARAGGQAGELGGELGDRQRAVGEAPARGGGRAVAALGVAGEREHEQAVVGEDERGGGERVEHVVAGRGVAR